MSECNHDCSSCGESNCGSRIEKTQLNEKSHIKKVIGIVSGKGGVGKSYCTSLIACALARRGHKVGIMDADVTGPSIPKAFGAKGPCMAEDGLIEPIPSRMGIKLMSANFLLDNEEDPIIWRGSLLSNLVKQFYKDVYWGELEYLLIDMPPGTGDITLTVFQSLPVDEIVIVTSPQDLVSLIVKKALKMAELMNIKVAGVVENMSYALCPDCNKRINIFGDSKLEEFSKEMNFKVLGQLPIVPENTKKVDAGCVEEVYLPEIEEVVDKLIKE